MSSAEPLRIDVWSDVVCPFCWIGKRHLEQALDRLGLVPGRDVDVVLKAFRLAPDQVHTTSSRDYLAARYGAQNVDAMWARVAAMGAASGLRFDFERALAAPTRDAHRLILHAQEQGLGLFVMERFAQAHFAEGADLADHPTLRRLAVEAGLDAADADKILAGDAHAEQVVRDQLEAQAIGANGVPFFVLDGRYAVSGAQPVEAFVRVLSRVQEARAAATDAA